MSAKTHLRIPVDELTCVHACLVEPEKQQKDTIIVFSHGFSVDGAEVYRLFIHLSSLLSDQGYPCLLFDYRGSGYSDLDLTQMTFATEMQDLDDVIEHVKRKWPKKKILIWGVSLGCAVAAHVAAKRRDIDGLLLWSLSADLYKRYQARYEKQFSRHGYAYTANGCRIVPALVESLKGLNTFAAIRESRARCLLVHGDADFNAPIDMARRAHKTAPGNTELIEIKGGNHVFISQPARQKEAIQASLQWLEQPF